jgi:uncharacterized cupin superfamily protein
MVKQQHVVHLTDVPVEPIHAPAGSLFGGQRQRVGARVGARKLGYSFFIVPPGKAAFPCHTHTGNEEMIYIMDGEGILRFAEEEIAVAAETVIACPPGQEYAHQLINTGSADLRYLVVSTMDFPDICEYPDSHKVGAYATAASGSKVGLRALYLRDRNVDYYEGEDCSEIDRVLKSQRGS